MPTFENHSFFLPSPVNQASAKRPRDQFEATRDQPACSAIRDACQSLGHRAIWCALTMPRGAPSAGDVAGWEALGMVFDSPDPFASGGICYWDGDCFIAPAARQLPTDLSEQLQSL